MSEYSIKFETIHNYDTLKTGITLPVTLEYNLLTIDFEAKLDTGSSHCIFERRFEYGENMENRRNFYAIEYRASYKHNSHFAV